MKLQIKNFAWLGPKIGLPLAPALLLTFALALAAYALAPTPAPSPTLAPERVAGSAPTAAPIEPMTLKTNIWGPPRAFTKGWEWWGEQVTKRTGGAIRFEHFYNEALGGAREQIDNIRAGLFPMANIGPTYHPGKTPLYTIGFQPALTADVRAAGKAFMEISALSELKEELKRWNAKFLFPATIASFEYMGKKPVRTIADLKGLRIRATGGMVRLADKLGAVPVDLTVPEAFSAIERGTVDGVFFPWYLHGSVGIYEVSKYAAALGLGVMTTPVIINLDIWNKLEPRVQEIMLEVAAQVPDKYAEWYAQADAKWLSKFKGADIEIVRLPLEEKASLQKQGGRPIWEEWVKQMEGRKLPGRKVLDAYLTAIGKYEQ
jgi:TRAP-type transport system periplasmic protein